MIRFISDGIDMPQLNEQLLNRWITIVAADYDKRIGLINFIFCNDDKIIAVNRNFLGHDYYTDVITFDYSCFPIISGDIFISVDTVKSNAQNVGVDYNDELLRIIIHGVLHLTGQADKTPATKAEMTQKENLALTKLSEWIGYKTEK